METVDDSSVLFLSQNDVIESGVLDMEQCIERMISVFDLYNQNRVIMGESDQYLHGHMTTFPGGLAKDEASRLQSGSRFGAMPAYVGGDTDMVGVKWYGSVPIDPNIKNPPSCPPLLVLTDPSSGQPLVIMNGSTISTMRTGAMAAVGAHYLQGNRAETASIIGPGSVGQAAALGLDSKLGNLSEITIYHPNKTKADAFADKMEESITAAIEPTDSMKTAVSSADVIVAAASRNPSPQINSSWLPDDVAVIQLGDLDVSLDAFDTDRLFCDIRDHPLEFEKQVGWDFTREFTAAVDAGLELSSVRTLHELVGGEDTDPTTGTSICSSLGLPMEDIAWGTEVYRNAKKSNLGQRLSLSSDSPFAKPY